MGAAPSQDWSMNRLYRGKCIMNWTIKEDVGIHQPVKGVGDTTITKALRLSSREWYRSDHNGLSSICAQYRHHKDVGFKPYQAGFDKMCSIKGRVVFDVSHTCSQLVNLERRDNVCRLCSLSLWIDPLKITKSLNT